MTLKLLNNTWIQVVSATVDMSPKNTEPQNRPNKRQNLQIDINHQPKNQNFN